MQFVQAIEVCHFVEFGVDSFVDKASECWVLLVLVRYAYDYHLDVRC